MNNPGLLKSNKPLSPIIIMRRGMKGFIINWMMGLMLVTMITVAILIIYAMNKFAAFKPPA